MQRPHPFRRFVGELAGTGDDLVKLQMKVAEVGSHDVPVGLLALHVELDQVREDHLKVAGKGG